MPRETSLAEYEKGKIDALHDAGNNISRISAAINRSRDVIRKYINNRDGYGKKKHTGRPKALTQRDRRRLVKHIVETWQSGCNAVAALNLNVSRTTAWRVARSTPFLEQRKIKRKPPLKPIHKTARLAFGQMHMTWNAEWRNVIFSDEKKFNLDGPDGSAYYWHDLRKEEQLLSRRVMGGGSVMVWAGFCFSGKSPIVLLRGKQNTVAYERTLSDNLLPFIARLGGGQWQFVQDNATIHSKLERDGWFTTHNIAVIKWPSRSPDLNPIENLWASLARLVYANGTQFQTVKELEEAIGRAWEAIDAQQLENLVRSMPNRIFELINKNGGPTSY
jgi:transposase